MKKAIFIVLLSAIYLPGFTQSSIRLNNFWENPYYITPASISNVYSTVFSMAARRQWSGFPGAPSTAFASATVYLDKMQTQFGVKVFEDKIGYTSTTNVSLSYAYALALNEDWRLHLGIAASYQSLSYDVSKVIIATQTDPGLYENMARESHYNADLGVELASKPLRIGIASQNIASLFSPGNTQQTNMNFLYAAYRNYTDHSIDLGGGVCGIQYNRLYQLELNATAYFKIAQEETERFKIGLFYRTPSEIGAIAGINLTNSFYISYSYDYNVSGISRNSTGTHEVMLVYRIIRDSECHTCY
jgi:type IX secretion system PorP/SprF family membrane protein